MATTIVDTTIAMLTITTNAALKSYDGTELQKYELKPIILTGRQYSSVLIEL